MFIAKPVFSDSGCGKGWLMLKPKIFIPTVFKGEISDTLYTDHLLLKSLRILLLNETESLVLTV